MILHIHSQKSVKQQLNLFGNQNIPIIVISLLEPKTSDILFQFNTLNHISTCIKQLEPVKWEVMQLLKDHFNLNKTQINWSKDIVPIIRNDKIRTIITF
jgi:flagellar motor switch protein FliG